MATHSNSEPESRSPVLSALLWPPERAGEALYAAAREAGLPLTHSEVLTVPESLTADTVSQWIEAAAVRGGFEATPVAIAIDDIRGLAARAAPLLLRVGTQGGFLAIVRGGRRACTVIDPHLAMRRLSLRTLTEALRAPFEARLAPAIDAVTDRLAITVRARARARAALLNERLRDARLRGCWLLRLAPAAALGTEIRETQLPRRVAALVGAHFVQYALFLLSWWLLGRGVLRGTIDAGWLLGWILLLFSLIPFRLFATVMQGVLATTTGAALRRRLLRGALQVDREEVRRSGAGHLFGHVMETAAVESLALTGGVGALFAVLELAVAASILIAGATAVTAGVLIVWTLGTLWLTARYFRTRRVWTRDRLSITHRLLESMLGHRTRLAQQPVEQWHPDEDASLAQYLEASRHMDRSAVWLNAFIPRGWLAVALGTLILPALRHASPTELAISIGGILLAHRSLGRFVAGLSQITGAAVAGEAILPLIRASLRRDRSSPPHPSAVIGNDTTDDPVAIQARDINFRYPQQTDHVLQNCTLAVARGSRLLLEGASGAGKTTLASLLAGLLAPDSGLVLVNGLDKSVLGASGWRKRVVMAPQAHDNYLIGASLAFNLLMGVQWPPQRSDLLEADAVCRELGLGDLLDRLPGGLHQIVGETGWQLSQGERTRVFLARALLQKPDVLVLDESFSALDPENVDRAIRCVMRRATTVVAIAHP